MFAYESVVIINTMLSAAALARDRPIAASVHADSVYTRETLRVGLQVGPFNSIVCI
jgi:hypothetical protein